MKQIADEQQTRKKSYEPSRLHRILPWILFFVIWELLARLNGYVSVTNPAYFPGPMSILGSTWELAKTGLIWESVVASTFRILTGFAIGCVLAVLLGVLMNRYILVETWVGPVLTLTGAVPCLALLPLFIIWMGIGETPKIIMIAWATFLPILVYTLDGLKSVNANLIRSAMSLGASSRQIFLRVILPSTIPNILVGANLSLGLAFSALIVSEMMGARSGIGYIIVDARNFFKVNNMFVAIILISLEFSLFAYLLKLLEKRVISWREGGLRLSIER
jgi:ABC-type nitrate/sulfonate/bicarbonate transport system permease component